MRHMAICTIIVVTYNGWPVTSECLAALEAERQTGAEVVVVDNGSSDGTPDLLRREFGWANVVEVGRNLGFAAANNLGIRRSSSEFVVLLNSDAIVQPGTVGALIETISSERRIGSAAATMVFQSRPDVVASAGIDVFSNGLALDRALGRPVESIEDHTPIFGSSAGAAIYRREALDDVGLFPEAFFMYLEDVDLAWRLRLRGWESRLSTGAIVEHLYSASSVEGSPFKRRLLARNRIWYVVRCFPGWFLRRHGSRIAAYDLMVGATAVTRRDGASLTGRLRALAGLRPRLSERGHIQRRITAKRSEIEPWILKSPSPRELVEIRRLAGRLAAPTS